MIRTICILLAVTAGSLFFADGASAYTLPELSAESMDCMQCHKETSPIIYEQWGDSKHFRANAGCYECHKAEKTDPDVFEHFGKDISVIVSPKDCAKCHEKEVQEFADSRGI